MLGILDPTIATARETIAYVPRPRRLEGLRIGVVENTTTNAEAVLRALAHKLESSRGMKMEVLVHKGQRATITGAQIAQLKGSDFVITGVGA